MSKTKRRLKEIQDMLKFESKEDKENFSQLVKRYELSYESLEKEIDKFSIGLTNE